MRGPADLWPPGLLDLLPRGAVVVEIGVGKRFDQAEALRALRRDVHVLVTDLRPGAILGAPHGIHGLVDDITHPNEGIYGGASLLYALRLPEELQVHAARMAKKVGATLAFVVVKDELAHDAAKGAALATDAMRRTWRIIGPSA